MPTKQNTRPAIEVHIDAPELGPSVQVGTLYPADVRINLAPSFEYTQEWLNNPQRFLLDPRLDLYGGEQHASQARGFGIFLDSAPDRWGRVLMERREASQAKQQARQMKRLTDLDFMLGVHDLTRGGALRYRRGPQEPFIDNHELPAPPVTDLRELAAIAHKLDEPDVERHHTFCVKRFDRGVNDAPQARRMYASAMTLLEQTDGAPDASYLDLVGFLETEGGAGLTQDLSQLFRRAVFNLLVGNRDDHLRNHGFIRLPTGWRLSPAFDMNPNRDKRQHALTWNGHTAEPDLDVLKETAPYYRINKPQDAQAIIDDIMTVVANWRSKAKALQLPSTEVQMMETVFGV